MTESETHDIVPDGVDRETLEKRMHASVDSARSRCPDCGYVLAIRSRGVFSSRSGDTQHYCKECQRPVARGEVVEAESRMAVLAE